MKPFRYLCLIFLLRVVFCLTSTAKLNSAVSASKASTTTNDSDGKAITLILCRHGDSIWNGGEPGTKETFTGWTDVPLSQKGVEEAKNTGVQVSAYNLGIDACFTSTLQRAQMTAHYCLRAFADRPFGYQPRKYIVDYRLNERHYGALQGFVKQDVEDGKHGHDPKDVRMWRRSWHVFPPLLDDDDPRRLEEIRRFSNFCGGPENIPRGESLEQVANARVRPFLQEVVSPMLVEALETRGTATGLVVAHANSLRSLLGVICEVENDLDTLRKLEALKIQTGTPLIIKFRVRPDGSFQALSMDGSDYKPGTENSEQPDSSLPIYPLSCIPLKPFRPTNELEARLQPASFNTPVTDAA